MDKVNDMKGVLFEGERLSLSPIYKLWSNMHNRAYGKYDYSKWGSYKSSGVCDEWFILSNFFNWVLSQDWRGKELDKDIIDPYNSIYSPDKCVFVPKSVNYLLLDSAKIRGKLPLGVHPSNRPKTPFKSECKIGNGKAKFLGRYKTMEEAHRAWQQFKLDRLINMSNDLLKNGEICHRAYDGLMLRVDMLDTHIKNGEETKSLHHLYV